MRLDEGTWNRILEGLPTLIGVAKSDSSRADFVFDENTPSIITGPFKLIAYRNGRPDAVETEQLSCRVKYWEFSSPTTGPLNRAFKPCPCCWATWIVRGELNYRAHCGDDLGDFLTRAEAALMPQAGGSAPAAGQPAASSGGMPHAPVPAAPAIEGPVVDEVAAASHAWFGQLEKLMAWRERGFLTDAEFAAAKAKLGLSAA